MNTINLSKHCQLCENKLFDIETGTTCGLNNRKPNFNGICHKIKFGENLKQVTKKINLEYELIKNTKNMSYYNLIFYLSISIGTMFLAYFIGKFGLESGVISTVPLIIFGIALSVLPFAFGPINKYNQGIKIAKKRKEALDILIKKYHLEYTIDFDIKNVHGINEVKSDLKFKGMQ